MLVIRKSIFDHFAALHQSRAVDRLVEHLERSFPEDVGALSRDALRARVERAIVRARGFGITEEQDVAEYLALSHELGGDLAEGGGGPWVSEILADPSVDGAEKTRRLRAAIEDLEGEPLADEDDSDLEAESADEFPELA